MLLRVAVDRPAESAGQTKVLRYTRDPSASFGSRTTSSLTEDIRWLQHASGSGKSPHASNQQLHNSELSTRPWTPDNLVDQTQTTHRRGK